MARFLKLRDDGSDPVEEHGDTSRDKKTKKKEQLDQEFKHTSAEVSTWKTSNINK